MRCMYGLLLRILSSRCHRTNTESSSVTCYLVMLSFGQKSAYDAFCLASDELWQIFFPLLKIITADLFLRLSKAVDLMRA